MIERSYLRRLITDALREDIGHGDITTEYLIPEGHKSKAQIILKEDCVLAGAPVVKEVFHCLDPAIICRILRSDGEHLSKGTVVIELEGPTKSLLSGERLALNLLQRLSGIATLTAKFVKELQGTSAVVVDTRKTTPGLRMLEKYAVRVGGGKNHRFGLYDGILIKDNHIQASGGISKAIKRAKLRAHHLVKIEIEVTTLEQLKEAIQAGADVVMLDNMNIQEIKKAVRFVRQEAPSVLLEASGGITLENVREIALTGVDIISVGALTHSANAIDISMYISPLAL